MITFEKFRDDVCPVCGIDVGYGDEEYDDGAYFTRNECNKCGAQWSAIYTLENVHVSEFDDEGCPFFTDMRKESL